MATSPISVDIQLLRPNQGVALIYFKADTSPMVNGVPWPPPPQMDTKVARKSSMVDANGTALSDGIEDVHFRAVVVLADLRLVVYVSEAVEIEFRRREENAIAQQVLAGRANGHAASESPPTSAPTESGDEALE